MPCVGFCGQSGIRVPLRQFLEVLGAYEGRLGEGSIYELSTGKYGRKAGSKSVQVKGRVAFGSLPARFTPPGKAVRGFPIPPIKWSLENPSGLEGSLTGCLEK